MSASPPDEIAKFFDALPPDHVQEPNYNVAPTLDVYVVVEDGGTRRMEEMHWGLVPRFAKSPAIGNKMINARAETVATNNAFKKALAQRRCLVPADGFYEWQTIPGQKKKQPMFVHRPDDRPLAFAGLWEIWRDREGDGSELHSCTIITTTANETMAPVHDRMPVILDAADWGEWLDPGNHDLDTVGRLLVPAPPTLLELRPVSTEVNNVRNNGIDLIARVDPATGEIHGQGTLL